MCSCSGMGWRERSPKPVVIALDHSDRRLLPERTEAFLADPQCLLGGLALRHVPDVELDRGSVIVEGHQAGVHFDRALRKAVAFSDAMRCAAERFLADSIELISDAA